MEIMTNDHPNVAVAKMSPIADTQPEAAPVFANAKQSPMGRANKLSTQTLISRQVVLSVL